MLKTYNGTYVYSINDNGRMHYKKIETSNEDSDESDKSEQKNDN